MDDAVHALTAHEDDDGPVLYAGGDFTTAGGVAANRIAKWNGSNWSALGSGMNRTVRALAMHDDGGGPALYAGGDFFVEAWPRAGSRGGTGRVGLRSGAGWTTRSVPWRCTTTAAGRRSTPGATSRPRETW